MPTMMQHCSRTPRVHIRPNTATATAVRAVFFLLALFAASVQAHAALPLTPEDLTAMGDALVRTPVQRDEIPALYRPRYVEAIDASLSLDDIDPVFIVPLPGGPRIYPQRIMVWHEVVNELLEDQPFCITYSPITGTATAYRSRTGRTPLIFGVEGRLLYGNTVMFDRTTESLWSQMLGLAFEGPQKGKLLERIPLYRTTWGHARNALPRALVLSYPLGSRRAYGKDPYGSYLRPGTYYDNDQLIYAVPKRDKRLPLKKRVIGIDFEGARAAIEPDAVRKAGVLNLTLGITPIAAVYAPGAGIIRIFDARIWGRPTTFEIREGKLRDRETGSVWTLEGKAVEGKLKDAVLPEIPGVESMWFAWFAFHPDTVVMPGNDPLSLPFAGQQ